MATDLAISLFVTLAGAIALMLIAALIWVEECPA
jgi:hypothetical protein